MRLVTFLPAVLPTKQPWFWIAADNHRRSSGAAERAADRADLRAPDTRALSRLARKADSAALRADARRASVRAPGTEPTPPPRAGGLDEFQRPLAARMLTDEVAAASPKQREAIRGLLREAGGRRLIAALDEPADAVATGARDLERSVELRAEEAVPGADRPLSDRSRYVARLRSARSAGSATSGRSPLAGLFATRVGRPGRSSTRRFVSIGDPSAQAFRRARLPTNTSALPRSSASHRSSTRRLARPLIERMLADQAGRGAGGRGGDARTGRRSSGQRRADGGDARRAATYAERPVSALASYDDPSRCGSLSEALDDPDRDTALRAGETLVRLSRVRRSAARRPRRSRNDGWPVETAR